MRNMHKERFVERRESSRRMILGIDPGISTGLALMDLDGNLVYAKSEREVSLNKIVDETTRYGKVVVVATDVTSAPELARKVASILNAIVFTPKRLMRIPEKRELVARYNQRMKIDIIDNHIRDAMASAIKALQKYRNKFEKLENEINDKATSDAMERAKELLVRGSPIDVAIRKSAKEYISSSNLKKHHFLKDPMKFEINKKIVEKTKIILRLSKLTDNLSDEIIKLKSEKKELRNRLERERTRSELLIRKDRLIRAQQNQIKNLTTRIHQLEKMLSKKTNYPQNDLKHQEGEENMTLLKTIDSFNSEDIERAEELFNIKTGDAVILKDARGGGASTAKRLVKLCPSIIISCTQMPYEAEEVLIKHTIPIVMSDHISIKKIRGNYYASTEEIRLQRKIKVKSLKEMVVKSILESYVNRSLK